MADIAQDNRVVLTLDAGGTNFDFSALKGVEEVVEPVRLPSNGNDLTKCIDTIKNGFNQLSSKIDDEVVAISFAFPGPADYHQGIIGDLNNLPAFRGGIPLKSILEKEFDLPVFINNDANLFVYGEAIAGLLPKVNNLLRLNGNPKRYNNLIGITLGTGFGGGFVSNGQMLKGDNSLGGEIWLTSSRLTSNMNADEAISIRAIRGLYAEFSEQELAVVPQPKEIALIAKNKMEGNRQAAIDTFAELGARIGEVLANLMTIYDGLVVIGGGIAHEHELIYPRLFERLNQPFKCNGKTIPRLIQEVYNLEVKEERERFLAPNFKLVEWPEIKPLHYDSKPNLGISVTTLGTRKSTWIGAYAYALDQLDRRG